MKQNEQSVVSELQQGYQETRDANVPDNLINLEGEISTWPEFLNHFQYLSLRLDIAKVERQDIIGTELQGIRKALDGILMEMKNRANPAQKEYIPEASVRSGPPTS